MNSLYALNIQLNDYLPYDIMELINEKVIINNVINTIKGTLDYACLNNNFRLLKLYHKYNLPHTHNAFNYACMNGNLEMILFLHNNGYKGNNVAMDLASKKGHFHVVKWLHNNNYSCSINALFFAETNYNINIINYICKNIKDIECDKHDLKIAIDICNFQIIQYVFNKIFNDNKNFVKYSSKHGLIATIRMINNLVDNYNNIL